MLLVCTCILYRANTCASSSILGSQNRSPPSSWLNGADKGIQKRCIAIVGESTTFRAARPPYASRSNGTFLGNHHLRGHPKLTLAVVALVDRNNVSATTDNTWYPRDLFALAYQHPMPPWLTPQANQALPHQTPAPPSPLQCYYFPLAQPIPLS
jgi:hypothetical protein